MFFNLFENSSFSKFAYKDNISNRSPIFTQSFVTVFELRRDFIDLPEVGINGVIKGYVDKVEKDVFNERSS